jgi:hypothetical protein
MDHDQRFKNLIKVFFQEFLLLFFKDWADRLDVAAVEWLDKELFPEPPEGSRHILDLVAKLPTRQAVSGQRPGEPDQWLALVHIEIESPDRLLSYARACSTPMSSFAVCTACRCCRSACFCGSV